MAKEENVRLIEGYQPLQKGYQPTGGLTTTAPSSGSGVNVGAPVVANTTKPSSGSDSSSSNTGGKSST